MSSNHPRSYPYPQNYSPTAQEAQDDRYQDYDYPVDHPVSSYDPTRAPPGASLNYQYPQPGALPYPRTRPAPSQYPPPPNVVRSSTPYQQQQPSSSYYQRYPTSPSSPTNPVHSQQYLPTGSEGPNPYPTYALPQPPHQSVGPYGHSGMDYSHPRQMNTEYGSIPQPSALGYPHASASSARSSTPSAIPERYMCNLCDKSFSRSHDRKRHYETQHSQNPAIHRCRYCNKPFSRGDSLKRHQDNGCDEMPEQ